MENLINSKEIKCIVWDLDNTLWGGTLLESGEVGLKPNIREIIMELDTRGILHSIASKNDYETAMEKLKEFKLDIYFLYPEIHWNPKSESIIKIQKNLNIGIDNILFIDDQPFERDEVLTAIPEINAMDAVHYHKLLSLEQLNPKFITQDSQRRRLMYLENLQRNREEEEFHGTKEEFLASLNMRFTISIAREDDLKRAEELTVRTNQLNATGRTYSYDELLSLIHSDNYILLVCELEDKYGSYGKIGIALIELKEKSWHLELLLMSCRVMSRSVGSVLLSYIMFQTKNAGMKLIADFKQTDKNKMMYATYKFANFFEISNDGNGNIVFENDLSMIHKFPPYVEIIYPDLY
jgi:FkbH-like protein